MIHVFDDYYIFESEDLIWYFYFCKCNDKVSFGEKLVIGQEGIVYSDYFTMCHFANNLSDSYKMINYRGDFEINYGTNWVLKDEKLFSGYFNELDLSRDWIFKGVKSKLSKNWTTVIGKGSLLKTWIRLKENENKTQFETHQIGATISFCREIKYSLSFDYLPAGYLLPIILKKII
jgi:hypothetical protein